MKKIILASASPRRREILEKLRIPFEVITSDLDESIFEHIEPSEYVKKLALEKAKSIQTTEDTDTLIIAADTVVVYDGRILGKPENKESAFAYLNMLSGKVHEVYSGLAILDTTQEHVFIDCASTKVSMRTIEAHEITSYIETNEPFDKAGGYAIQGFGAVFVEKIDGDYYNVVGLPVSKLIEGFKKLGYDYFRDLHDKK